MLFLKLLDLNLVFVLLLKKAVKEFPALLSREALAKWDGWVR